MKKIVTMLLAATLTFVLPVGAHATGEVEISQDSQEKSAAINVDYTVDMSYTVTIPASVTFTDSVKSVDRPLQVSDVRLNEGQTLNVGISSQNDFQMRNNDKYINYSLTINYATTPEENSFTLLTVKAGEPSGWTILTFNTDLQKDHAQYAGRYSDTLTFTVSIEP